jgi:membrane protease YdiL (CAAX protease family)
LLAVLAVAGPRHQLGAVFGRWRTNPMWLALALVAPPAVHIAARALDVALGGHLVGWFAPPVTSEQLAALVVFPLGEEFGWRGFAYPRLVERLGVVRGALLLGVVWGLWHLVYGVTPEAGAFDALEFGVGMIELPLYSVLIAWVFERSNRSMGVALAFHVGAHLDHIERAPGTDLRLHALHVVVLAAVALVAGRSPALGSAARRRMGHAGSSRRSL